MRTHSRPIVIGLWAALAVLSGWAADIRASDWTKPAEQEWPLMGGDWGNTRYSALTQINRENVKSLGAAWAVDFKTESSRGTPVIWGGVLYVHAGGTVYAQDAKTGTLIWKYKPSVPPGGLMKGVAVGEGLVFVGLSDSSMIALKQETGELVWTRLLGDEKPPNVERMGNQWVGGSPTYVNGLVIAGISGARAPSERNDGRLVAVNAKTGEIAWVFHVVPRPGEKGNETWPRDDAIWKKGGGAIWMTPAADPDLGLVYVGTGNPIPELGGQVRAGDNLFTAAVVALDIKTGKLKWYFQTTHHDIFEHDLGTPLILYDARVNGKTRKAIGIMRTDGYLFLLDRANGKPIIPVEERKVPQDAHLKTARTQPFPVGADQVGPNCAQKDMVPAGFVMGCYFDVTSIDKPNVLIPLTNMRSSPMAFSPATGFFFGAGTVNPRWLRLWEDPFVYSSTGSIPFVKSYGLLAALDSRTDKIAWQKKIPYQIDNGSGVTATAGGLLFIGLPDGNLQAYDTQNGDLLWSFQTGTNVAGAISVYEVGGEEYVSVLATNTLWSFKLGGAVPPRAAPTPPATETTFSGRIVATDTIKIAADFEDRRSMDIVRTYRDEYAFSPARAKLSAGSKVTWTNTGTETHEIVAYDGSWTTGPIAPGQSKSVTFDKPGTYVYICRSHPWSFGQLIVESDK